MEIEEEFRDSIRGLEAKLSGFKTVKDNLWSERQQMEKDLQGLRAQMGWRERHFNGNLGGNKKLVQQVSDLESHYKANSLEYSKASQSIITTDYGIYEAIRTYLLGHDETYRKLSLFFGAIETMRESVDSYFDLIGDVVSGLGTPNANEAAKKARLALPPFLKSTEDYRNFVKTIPPQLRDLLSGDFDVARIGIWGKLANPASDLERLYLEVSAIWGKIDQDRTRVGRKMNEHIHFVRKHYL